MASRIALTAATVIALAGTAVASAATTTYSLTPLDEPANPGLTVTGVLKDLTATSHTRILIPSKWQIRKAPAGQRRYANRNNGSCTYDLTYTAKSVLSTETDPEAYVKAKLPAQTSKHLLDSAVRGNRAYRVVRQAGIGGRVRLDALWAGVLTKRSDVAPSGQTAWTEIRVTAISRAGSECHSGTWRQALGPTIGDSLAVAKTTLHFNKMKS